MDTIKVTCSNCESDSVVKNGKAPSGLQRLCSSRGHLCSNLAQQGINIRLNREKYQAFYHLKSSVEQLHLAALC